MTTATASEIEAVAKAIYDRFHLRHNRPSWKIAPAETKRAFRCDARAIIEALEAVRYARIHKPNPHKPYTIEEDSK